MSQEFFIVYDLASGQEHMRGMGPEGITDIQRPPFGMAVLSLPQSVWTPTDRSGFEVEIGEALWERVKVRRDKAINGGALTPSGRVDSDEVSRTNITGAVVGAMLAQSNSMPFAIEWTLENNDFAVLDAAATIAMGVAVMGHVNDCHARARALRGAIEGAATVTDLLMIDIESGWPE